MLRKPRRRRRFQTMPVPNTKPIRQSCKIRPQFRGRERKRRKRTTTRFCAALIIGMDNWRLCRVTHGISGRICGVRELERVLKALEKAGRVEADQAEVDTVWRLGRSAARGRDKTQADSVGPALLFEKTERRSGTRSGGSLAA